MQQHVAVGVSGETLIVGQLHPTNLQRDAWFEFMRVPTVTDSQVNQTSLATAILPCEACFTTVLLGDEKFCQLKIARGGDLNISRGTHYDMNSLPGALQE